MSQRRQRRHSVDTVCLRCEALLRKTLAVSVDNVDAYSTKVEIFV
jgi:hypothetical protein